MLAPLYPLLPTFYTPFYAETVDTFLLNISDISMNWEEIITLYFYLKNLFLSRI